MMARWRRKSPATILLALLLSLAQVQFALAAIVNTVTVTGSFNGVPVTNTAVESVDVEDATPSMTVLKTGTLNDDDGTAGITAGDTIDYEVTAENTGNISITNVAVTDPLVTLVFDPLSDADSDGELDVDETWRWTGSYVLTAGDISTNGGGDGDIDNTATVTSDELPDQTGSAEVPLGLAPAYTVVKAATLNDDDGTPGQSAGDTIDYTVTLTNTGNQPLTGIIVNDPLVSLTLTSGDTGSDNILGVGEVWVYNGTYTILQGDIDTDGGGDGLIDNTVTVSTDQLADQTASADVAVNQAPNISLVKVADTSGTNTPGDPINYTITATNTGNMTLTNVTVNDPLLTPDTQICPSVAPLGTCVLTGTYTTVPADFVAGNVVNNASVTSDEGAGDTTGLTTPITLGAGLTVTKSAVPTTINNPGETITYTVVVANTGNVPLSGVTVTDPLLTLDCGGGSNLIATLPFGGSQTCTGTYTVLQSDFDAGPTLLNTATANDDGTYGVSANDNETVNLIASPSMVVTKVGVLNDDDGIGGVSAGDTISYTISIFNDGNVPISNVVPNDPMAVLTLDSGDTDNDSLLDVGETWTYTGSYPLTQADIDTDGGGDGNIENTVTVSSTELPDQPGNATVPLNINPSMDLTKVGVLNDDDGSPGLTAGDTISYTVTVTNTGNIRLTNVAVSDPLVALTYASGDTNSDNRLDVDEVWSYTGTTIITQGDLDTLGGGDGDIDNTATVSADQLPPQDVSHELPIAPVSSMEIKKVATTPVQIFPTVFDFDYQITVRNTGAVTQTNIRVEDDVASAVAPGTLLTTPSVTVSGFAGPGGFNVGFDGDADQQLLTGDVQLAPGGIAVITISVRIDTAAQTINGLNTALLTSDLITVPLPSDDPNRTPGVITDVNPTPVELPDTDGDGATDSEEDDVADRDGDGDPNSTDYDPTGYFYCQADGRILSGGLITVENLTSGGSQTGVGSSNGIVILRDGSDGRYQFHATQAGDYRLTYVLPATGIASTTLISSGTLDATSLLPDNPGIVGSGEFGSTGILADATPAANPFYTVFEIEAGDPAIFNNNIPLQFCGSPLLSADKSVETGPDVQPDLRHQVTYRLNMTASGDEPVNDVQMVDDLAAVFGSGNFTVDSYTIDSAPAGFATDPFYNGDSNTALLTSGGVLQPGETVSVLLTVTVNVVDGVYSNALVANGTSPLDGSPVPPSSDNADITISNVIDTLVVEKTAVPGSARIGDPVAYTITLTNSGATDLNDIDVVDMIPNGMTYVEGSARVNGVASEPDQGSARRLKEADASIFNDHSEVSASGRELVWEGLTIPAGSTLTITLTLIVNASASGEEYINLAFAQNGSTGAIISNIAKARVRSEIDPVFECSDLIGRVFDDLNRDGYMDDGEPGLPGVRLATPSGLLVTTDKFGRYSIACGAIPDADIGSNFIMKLDERTLPTGYRITTENPRVVRLTRGKLSKLNFGAANLRLVRFELSDDSFVGGSLRAKQETLSAIGGMLSVLDDEPSVLRLVYAGPIADKGLARQRLQSIEDLFREAWNAKPRANMLTTETRLVD